MADRREFCAAVTKARNRKEQYIIICIETLTNEYIKQMLKEEEEDIVMENKILLCHITRERGGKE